MFRYAVAIVVLILILPAPVAAQGAAAAAPPLRARDSARALATARSEQARFELIRRQNLPWTDAGGRFCEQRDERIGRFCLTFGDDGDSDWQPAPEKTEITRARDRLVARLDSAARLFPGDPWVSGQRVRYLVEARRFVDADSAARACRAARWWCSALSGFAHHYAGQPAAADSAFADMLGSMPLDERRRWTDLSRILDACTLRLYRQLNGEERARFEERFWALADPFLTRPGNDLRSEHLARNLMDALQDRAKSTENLSWGNDLREILIRYGVPTGWERVRPRLGSVDPPSLISHYSDSDQRLLPPCQTLASGDVAAGVWDEEELRPTAGYSIPLADSAARWIHPLDHQFAIFRKGDSAIVVAAYSIPSDSIPAGATLEVGLALAGADGAAIGGAPLSRADAEGVLTAQAAAGAALMSLEIISEDARLAARTRQGVRIEPLIPDRLALSDLLLLRSPGDLPDSLSAAMAAARPSTRVHADEEIGVYWELYGMPTDTRDTITLSLRLLDRQKGAARRIAERIGIIRSSDPIRMQWTESPPNAITIPRALTFRFPAKLPPGSYTLELTAESRSRGAIVTEREVEVGDN